MNATLNSTELEEVSEQAQTALQEIGGNGKSFSAADTRTSVFFMTSYFGSVQTAVSVTTETSEATMAIDVFVGTLTNFTSTFAERDVDQSELDAPLVQTIDDAMISAAQELVNIGEATSRSYTSARARVQLDVAEIGQEIRFDGGLASSFIITGGSVEEDNSTSLFAATITEYEDDTLFPHTYNETRAQIGSPILSVLVTTFMNGTVVGIFDYSFNLKANLLASSEYVPECVWYVEPTSGSEKGSWNTDGCTTTILNNSHARCDCKHLTSFAVLVSSDGSESVSQSSSPHAETLSIVTYVGVVVSLAGIFVTVTTILGVPKLRRQLRYQILLHLVTALGMALLFFCFFTTPTTKSGCEFVSFGALYFFVASVLWNLVEAYDLYQTFCIVFNDGQTRASFYMRRFSLFAWGGAVLSPVLAFAIDRPNFITMNETSQGTVPTLCWINMATPIRWAFLGPVGAVIITNSVIAFKIVQAIRRHVKHKKYNSVRYTAKIVANVSVVTGLTWIFAVMVVLTSEVAFSYLFAIFASSQGATVFYFHVYTNEMSRNAWKALIRVGSGTSSSGGASRGHMVRARRRQTAWNAESSQEPFSLSAATSIGGGTMPQNSMPWHKGLLIDTDAHQATVKAPWLHGPVLEEVDSNNVITVGKSPRKEEERDRRDSDTPVLHARVRENSLAWRKSESQPAERMMVVEPCEPSACHVVRQRKESHDASRRTTRRFNDNNQNVSRKITRRFEDKESPSSRRVTRRFDDDEKDQNVSRKITRRYKDEVWKDDFGDEELCDPQDSNSVMAHKSIAPPGMCRFEDEVELDSSHKDGDSDMSDIIEVLEVLAEPASVEGQTCAEDEDCSETVDILAEALNQFEADEIYDVADDYSNVISKDEEPIYSNMNLELARQRNEESGYGLVGNVPSDATVSTLNTIRFGVNTATSLLSGKYDAASKASTVRFEGADSTFSSVGTLRFGQEALFSGQFGDAKSNKMSTSTFALDDLDEVLIIEDGLFLFPRSNITKRRRKPKTANVAWF